MATPPRRGTNAGRSLLALLLVFVAVFGVVGITAASATGKKWTPELGLDLEGGTQIVLEPVVAGSSGGPSSDQLRQSVDIIRARIDGSGVGEAEVTTEGGQNVVIAVPGKVSDQQRNLIKQSSQLRFRVVLAAQPVTPPAAPTPTPSGTATPSGTPSGSPAAIPTPTATPTATLGQGTASPSSAQAALPQALLQATTPAPTPSTPARTPAATPAATPVATPPAAPSASPSAPAAADSTKGTASDLAQVSPALVQQFTALDCSDTTALQGGTDDPARPFVTCSQDGTEKYVLGPAEVVGTDISNATAGLVSGANGTTSNIWGVNLSFDGAGTEKFRDVTARITSLQPPQNRFAVELDGLIITAPTSNQVIPNGQAQITGSFTQSSATELASQLKFGALPISFETQTEDTISPLLGAEQLQRGLLAGLIGLVLVMVYSIFQYRGLALVSIASLGVWAALTYGAVVLLGQSQGFRLSLAGVTGLIVSIGITADSFIVYFERVRDEVRDGRTLRQAVETGWKRARRTILAADAINFLAAIVLYLLAAGNVRGFAYTLGLTTIVDVVVVFLFTHPLLALLARTKFYGGGHRLSGLDPDRLGATSAKVGLKANIGTIAGRRAAARRPSGATPVPKEA